MTRLNRMARPHTQSLGYSPAFFFRIICTTFDHNIFCKLRNNVGKTYGFFFLIGKPGHFPPFNNELTVLIFGIYQSNRSMTYS